MSSLILTLILLALVYISLILIAVLVMELLSKCILSKGSEYSTLPVVDVRYFTNLEYKKTNNRYIFKAYIFLHHCEQLLLSICICF